MIITKKKKKKKSKKINKKTTSTGGHLLQTRKHDKGEYVNYENDITMGDGKVAHLRNGDDSGDDSPSAKRVK